MKKLLTILFCITGLIVNAQQKIDATGGMAPTGSYRTATMKNIAGKALSVQGIADRNAIQANLRDTGMLVFVRNDTSFYTLVGGITNSDWVEFGFAGGGLNSLDSIFITTTDSIFIITGNDTIYIGNSNQIRDTAHLTAQYGVIIFNDDSTYKPNGDDVPIGVDTSVIRQFITQVINGDTTIINNSDSTPAVIVDSIANAPIGSEPNGTKYLVGTSPTGAFALHENDIAEKVGGVWTFTDPVLSQQLIVDNAITYATYQWNGTVWRQTSILWRVNGNRGIGRNGFLGKGDKQPVFFRAWNKIFMQGDTTRHVYFPKWTGLENETVVFRPGVNGMLDTVHWHPVAPGTNVTFSYSGDTTYINSTGGGGSQNFEDVLQVQGSDPFTTDNTVDLADKYLKIGGVYGNLELGGEVGAGLTNYNDTSSTQIHVVPAADELGGLGVSISATGASNAHSVLVYPDMIQIESNNDNTNIRMRGLDSSNADADNIMWMDENSIVHRGHISASGGVTSIATTSPITGGTITGTGTIGINNAAADGSTKGASSFTANDFDASSGNISIDYTNGQAVDATHKGFAPAGTSALKVLHGDGTWKDTVPVVQFSGLANRLPYWSSSTNIGYSDSIFVDNTNTRIGLGTNTPTATITFDSARSNVDVTGRGLYFYATRDQVTNYSGLRIGYSPSNGAFGLVNFKAGTGALKPLFFNAATTFVNAAGTSFTSGTIIANSVGVFTDLLFANQLSLNGGLQLLVPHDWTNSSGQGRNLVLYSGVQTTGTASATSLLISNNVSSTGSGKHTYIDLGTRTGNFPSGNHVAVWRVFFNGHTTIGDSTDNGYMLEVKGESKFTRPLAFTGSTPSNTPGTGAGTSPTITVTGNDASGYVTIATGSSPTASGNIVTVTFATALTNTPTSIQLTPANEAAATEGAKVYVDQATASTTAWIIKNTSSALTGSTTYKFYYTITQ